MIKALRDLQAYCELVIFTYLPRSFCDAIVARIPQFKDVFSFILCQEDCIATEAYLIKDQSILLGNRSIEDIVVIDSNLDRVDTECVSTINPAPYDGSVFYTQLSSVK